MLCSSSPYIQMSKPPRIPLEVDDREGRKAFIGHNYRKLSTQIMMSQLLHLPADSTPIIIFNAYLANRIFFPKDLSNRRKYDQITGFNKLLKEIACALYSSGEIFSYKLKGQNLKHQTRTLARLILTR